MESCQEAPITQIDKYSKVKVLGKGSMGKVYLMQCNDDKQYYVVKRIRTQHLNDKQRQKVHLEVRLMQMLDHPNVISLKEVYTTVKQKLCIVMEYAERGDLDMRISEQQAKNKHFQEKTIMTWFGQILEGLNYVHSKQIGHRDLKSANIFLTKDEVCKIGDFGISRLMDKTMDSSVFAGTPKYLSPEMVEGKTFSFKSDIWALGVILYQLCTFKMPFQANSLPLLALKIIRGSFAPLPKGLYSKELRQLIESLLKIDMSKRPSTSDLMKQPYVRSYLKHKTETKTVIAQPKDQDAKRQALRKEMRDDLKKKRSQFKKTVEPKQPSPVETKKSTEEQPAKDTSITKAYDSIKPWKKAKKHTKLENMEIEVLVPKKKQPKQVIQEPVSSNFTVEIKISDKVKERLQKTKLAALQKEESQKVQSASITPPKEQSFDDSPQPKQQDGSEGESVQEDIEENIPGIQLLEDVRNAVKNVNQVASLVKLEDVHFSEYEDSHDFDNEQEVEKQTTLSKQDQESLKYIVNSNSLEELRMILEERIGEYKFLRAYKILKEYVEKRVATSSDSVFNKEVLRQMLYFLEPQLFEDNIVLLYTLLILEDEEMKNNLDKSDDD